MWGHIIFSRLYVDPTYLFNYFCLLECHVIKTSYLYCLGTQIRRFCIVEGEDFWLCSSELIPIVIREGKGCSAHNSILCQEAELWPTARRGALHSYDPVQLERMKVFLCKRDIAFPSAKFVKFAGTGRQNQDVEFFTI